MILWVLMTIVAMLLLMSCTEPVLNKNEYKIIDTLSIGKNGFNAILDYSVIIKYDSSFYYGRITPKGELTYINPRKIKVNKLK